MTKAPLGGEKTGPNPDFSGQVRRQAQPADRGPWSADWLGG
jgi:hypothetical protein